MPRDRPDCSGCGPSWIAVELTITGSYRSSGAKDVPPDDRHSRHARSSVSWLRSPIRAADPKQTSPENSAPLVILAAPQARSTPRVEVAHARIGLGRHFGDERAAAAGEADGAKLSRLHHRHGHTGRNERHLNLAAHQARDDLGLPLKGTCTGASPLTLVFSTSMPRCPTEPTPTEPWNHFWPAFCPATMNSAPPGALSGASSSKGRACFRPSPAGSWVFRRSSLPSRSGHQCQHIGCRLLD